MTMIRVLLVDDHPIVRGGIRDLLSDDKEIMVVGEASNGADGLRLAEELRPDVVVLDMELPDIPGPVVARQMLELVPGQRILALSGHDDREYIRELMRLGAAGYLLKEEAPTTILQAVRGAAAGENGWLSRRIAAQLGTLMDVKDSRSSSNLTPRELQVVRLVVSGKTNQAIGLALSISEKTVEKYLDAIFTKLNASSRVEVAVYAVRNRLVR